MSVALGRCAAERRPQRARPRLRRLRSAGLSFRGLGFAFDPCRAPSAASAALARTGARLRASRQMKNEIPPRTTSAPIAIAITPGPLSPLSVPFVFVVLMVGVVVVGNGAEDGGSPGVNGLVAPCA